MALICGNRMKDVSKYEELVGGLSRTDNTRMFKEFLEKHGSNYSHADLLKFLKKRYKIINQHSDPSGSKSFQGS